MLVSVDEDLRIGVQVAQTFGIRVHLLGFADLLANAAQSRLFSQQVDTRTIWDSGKIKRFLSQREERQPIKSATVAAGATLDGGTTVAVQIEAGAAITSSAFWSQCEASVAAYFASLAGGDVRDIATVYESSRKIPFAYNRNSLQSPEPRPGAISRTTKNARSARTLCAW